MSWAAIMAAAEPCEGGYRAAIPETWLQGRTAYGGLSSALVLDAAIRAGGAELPPLRSAQIAMIAPVFGEVTVTAHEVRRGKNVTWMAAELSTEKGTAITASFAFQRQQDSAMDHTGYPVPEGLIPVGEAKVFENPRGPVFLREQMEVRFALPRAEEKRAELCWWVRLKERAGLDAMTELMLIADTLPPGVMPLIDLRAPASTMHWHCNLLDPAPATEDGWWLLRSASDYARAGFSSEPLMTWNAAGNPMMASMQSVAIFG
ncbi:MAG: thioesterase family protein [Sphingomonadaceae bacterium]